jgi:hypothetical protein
MDCSFPVQGVYLSKPTENKGNSYRVELFSQRFQLFHVSQSRLDPSIAGYRIPSVVFRLRAVEERHEVDVGQAERLKVGYSLPNRGEVCRVAIDIANSA